MGDLLAGYLAGFFTGIAFSVVLVAFRIIEAPPPNGSKSNE